jgi:hypothetical protein
MKYQRVLILPKPKEPLGFLDMAKHPKATDHSQSSHRSKIFGLGMEINLTL